MKQLFIGIVIVLSLFVAQPAEAQYRGSNVGPQLRHHPHPPPVIHSHRPQRHWHPNHGWVWVIPTIIGGAIVYDIARQQNQYGPTVTEEIIVPANPSPRVVECSEWREVYGSDNRIYRERTCRDFP